MALFRRQDPRSAEATAAPASSAIAEFWAWWHAGGSAQTAAALVDGDPHRMVRPIGSRVHAIHPELAWELAAGKAARYLLVVSPEGDPELRGTARRWLHAAPPPDQTWEYADARQPAPSLAEIRLGINGHELALADIVVTARRVGYRFDLVMHHPLFSELPHETRMQICFLALDTAIGERDVETWLGDITAAEVRPLDAFALEHVRGLVESLAAEATDELGQPTWVMLQGERPEGPVLALAQVPLSATVAPELDLHLGLTVPFAPGTADGLPTDEALQRLRDFEDHLTERLGESGRLVAHETCAGVRILHFYVDSTRPGIGVLRAAIAGWPDGEVQVEAAPDPAWRAVHHLRA